MKLSQIVGDPVFQHDARHDIALLLLGRLEISKAAYNSKYGSTS